MKQWAKRAAWPAAGLALGLAVFLAVYGPLPLEVTNDSWLLGGNIMDKDTKGRPRNGGC